jgi:hypothetical protein
MKNLDNAILVLIGIVTVLTLDHAIGARDDLEAAQAEYCEMVQLRKDTGGQFGWPDYKGNAKEVCK